MNHHTLQSTDNSNQLFCCLYAHSQHTQDLQSACKIKMRARLMDFQCWFALLAPCAQNSTDVTEKWTMWLKRDRRWYSCDPEFPKNQNTHLYKHVWPNPVIVFNITMKLRVLTLFAWSVRSHSISNYICVLNLCFEENAQSDEASKIFITSFFAC